MTDIAIRGLVPGTSLNIDRPTVTGIPTGRVLAKAWLTIKEHPITDGDPGIIQKIITTTLQIGIGQITDVGDGSGTHPVGEGALMFVLRWADTLLLSADKLYYYDIKLQLDNGDLLVPEKGTILLDQGVTAATG